MPRREFKHEVKKKLHNFMEYSEKHVESLVNYNENQKFIGKVSNYLRNYMFRHTGMKLTVSPFGSRVIGCATIYSDLDLYVQVENRKGKSIANILNEIKNALSRRKIWKVKILILNTPVPILRVQFTPKRFDLEIVVSNPIGVHDSLIMKHLVNLDEDNEIQKLFFFLFKWIKEINDIKIKKMILFYLVIFYLQRHDRLPSLIDVHNYASEIFVNDWEVQFDSSCTIYDYNCYEMDDYREEAFNFFKFYANYEFADYVIDIHSGESIPSYERDFSEAHMYMAAPLDYDRNVARIGKATLDKFQRVCKKSISFLERYYIDNNEE